MKKSDLMVLVLVLSGSFLAVSAFLLPDLFSQNEEIKILDIQNVGPDKKENNQKKNDDLISKVEKGDGGRAKLTDDQISEHLEFWIGKWDAFDKSTNQIIDSIELKWKEKGKSLESKGIIFEGGEQKDKFKGSISYDKKLGVFVDVQTFEASGETFIRHSILNLETQSEHGFPVKPESPEDIDIKFTYKKVNQNNVDFTFEVLREGETLEKRELIIKRQGVEPKEDDPKADRPKLTDDQISEHLEFWIGKWEGYDKPSNEIGDKFESKWKEKGKSLAFVGIAFEDGEQKDTYKGSIHYNRELNVFVDTLTYEKSGVTYKRHSVLDPESGVRNGFPVEPEPPEDIEVKFKWKEINRNNVDYSFKVLRGNETLEYKEFSVKRQIDKPKADPEIIKQREQLTTNLITSMGEFADALAGIEDKKSALDAAAKFGGIAEKLEALAMKMEVLGFPEGSQAEEINSQMTKFEKEMQQKMNKSIQPIFGNEELNEVLMPAFMKFGERMDKLNPVMEKWAGKKRASDPPKEEIALEAPKVEDVNSETLITLSIDGNEVTAERNIDEFPEFDFFYITSSGAFSIDEIRIGKTHDSVTQKSISDDEENIIFHDSFEYATGEKLINHESWYSDGLPRHISNSHDTYTISEGSLVNEKIKSVGNRVSAEATDVISGIGIGLPDRVSFAPGDNVYISFLIRPEGVIGEGVWGGYFSFGAKPLAGKGILFGKPGDSSAPDDKKFAIDQQGGPIIRTSGVETEVGKTSHVIVRLESKILDEFAEEKARVKEDLNALQISYLNYKIAAGNYPTTEQGLQALLTKPAEVRGWEGPYFDEAITDPWANEYGYRFPSQKGQKKPDIFSKGPDGQENTEDDIGNWPSE
ncbi:MAG: type II secretion system protein GspG [Verrucomicrobiales bacterium]